MVIRKKDWRSKWKWKTKWKRTRNIKETWKRRTINEIEITRNRKRIPKKGTRNKTEGNLNKYININECE